MIDSDLTVIIPVFNGIEYIKESVDSILNQSYKNFNLLVIDDGSTDGSYEYLSKKADNRLTIYKQENLGLCFTLNKYIKSVSTEYIARLDQDDIALNSRLFEQVSFLKKNPSYDVVLSLVNRIGANGYNFGYYHIYNPNKYFFDYDPLKYGTIAHSTMMFNKKVFMEVGGYRSELYPVDDLDLLHRLHENYKVAVINKPLVNYRIHQDAFTFKYFNDMKLKTSYVNFLAKERKLGRSEITLSDYQNKYKQSKVSMISDLGELLFRKAGSFWGCSNYFLSLLYLFLALILNPSNTLKRLNRLQKAK